MSIDIVKQRLSAACKEVAPKVVFLTGGWGEGKTYQWRLALQEAQKQAKPPKYAYVSLFGINSLADARKRLSEEFVAAIRVPGEEGSLGSKFSELTSGAKYLQGVKLLPLIPLLGKADALVNELSFSVVRNAVICIDDIERKGAGLSMADIFGLASFLKEERDCRVILVANSSRFAEQEATTVQTFLEKVVDEHVHFAPTPEEACDIAIGATPSGTSLMLRKHMLSLGVANIRVIGRLNRLSISMSAAVDGVDEKVVEIGVLALAVFGVGHFMPGVKFPPIEFVLARHEVNWMRYAAHRQNAAARPDEQEAQAREMQWEELLNRVGTPTNDPFEVALADAIRQGYLATNLKELATTLAGKLGERALVEQYHEVWTDFYHSLNGTGDELLDALAQTTKGALAAIGPADLRKAYDVFVEAGRAAQADALLEEFIDANRSRPQIFDRSRTAFPEYWTGEFGDRLDAAAAQYIVRPSTEEALDRLDINQYNAADASIVAQAAPEVLEQLLKASSGRKFRSRIRVFLALGSMAPNDPAAAAASAHFAATLRAWADADPITRIRMAQYLPRQSANDGPPGAA